MMLHEFVDKVNAIREGRGLSPITCESVPSEDYAVVEYVYTWHPAFDVPNAKQAIAEVYCV